MPWTGTSIRKHNHALRGEKAGHAARIANAVLKSSGNEGTALAVASKWAKTHRRAPGGAAPQVAAYQTAAPLVNDQGFVPVPQTGTYNLDLTTGALQPDSRDSLKAFAQRGLPIKEPSATPPPAASPILGMAGLSPINLGAMAGFGPAWSLAAFNAAANSLPPASPPPASPGGQGSAPVAQPAIGTPGGPSWWQFDANTGSGNNGGGGSENARGGRIRRASGGPALMSASQASPWWARSEARGEEHVPSGLIQGPSFGRQDNVPMNLAPHSHVIPADVVSGWGQGNTSAGAVALQHALSTGPYGTALPRVPTRPPRALIAPVQHLPKLASGGSSDGIRTLLSHGEVIVPPEDVHRIGGGDFKKGHDWLDRMIVDSRKQIIARTRKLPGPVKE